MEYQNEATSGLRSSGAAKLQRRSQRGSLLKIKLIPQNTVNENILEKKENEIKGANGLRMDLMEFFIKKKMQDRLSTEPVRNEK